jgi:GTP-binding protein HflX
MAEARALWKSLDCLIDDEYIFTIKTINPKYYIGPGQLGSIVTSPGQVVFFDLPLSPVHRREIEDALKVPVFDREEVILRIFGARAQTAEGKLQVQVAQLLHQRRKLVGAWSHLDKQRGGVGNRGVGEMQKELDRRLLEDKIKRLKVKLAQIKNQRAIRRRKGTVALVGYTNAGKTSALKYLTRDTIKPSTKLFATLDPRTKAWHLDGGQCVPLVDTVGFISDLPHSLVDAFHATLSEAAHADVVLHVHDASDPECAKKGECVEDTLRELGVDINRVIDVWNKCDISTMQGVGRDSGFAVSSITGEGWDAVAKAVGARLGVLKRTVYVPDYTLIPTPCSECTPLGDGFLVKCTLTDSEWIQLRKKIKASRAKS